MIAYYRSNKSQSVSLTSTKIPGRLIETNRSIVVKPTLNHSLRINFNRLLIDFYDNMK